MTFRSPYLRRSTTSSTTSSTDNDDIYRLLPKLYKLRKEIALLTKEENLLKQELMELMGDKRSIASDKYEITRRYQKKEFVSQKDLPIDIWEEYARVSEFPIITVKKLKY